MGGVRVVRLGVVHGSETGGGGPNHRPEPNPESQNRQKNKKDKQDKNVNVNVNVNVKVKVKVNNGNGNGNGTPIQLSAGKRAAAHHRYEACTERHRREPGAQTGPGVDGWPAMAGQRRAGAV